MGTPPGRNHPAQLRYGPTALRALVGQREPNRYRQRGCAQRIGSAGLRTIPSRSSPQPAAATINRRVGVVERALRNEFPDAASPFAPGFHHFFWRRSPLGFDRPRPTLSRLRVKEPTRILMPLSVDEVARFWSSFRTSRDLAIVGLMLLQGLRSKEVIALNCEDVLLSESQMWVRGKGNKIRCLPLASDTVLLLDHYLRLERPQQCGSALFVSLKGQARGRA